VLLIQCLDGIKLKERFRTPVRRLVDQLIGLAGPR
jgi:hypothetical protein